MKTVTVRSSHDEGIKKFDDLLHKVSDEQPDSSGHNFLNRYFPVSNDDGSTSLVRPGNVPVAVFNTEHEYSAALAAVANPEMLALFFDLLKTVNSNPYASAEERNIAETLKWKLNYLL